MRCLFRFSHSCHVAFFCLFHPDCGIVLPVSLFLLHLLTPRLEFTTGGAVLVPFFLFLSFFFCRSLFDKSVIFLIFDFFPPDSTRVRPPLRRDSWQACCVLYSLHSCAKRSPKQNQTDETGKQKTKKHCTELFRECSDSHVHNAWAPRRR